MLEPNVPSELLAMSFLAARVLDRHTLQTCPL